MAPKRTRAGAPKLPSSASTAQTNQTPPCAQPSPPAHAEPTTTTRATPKPPQKEPHTKRPRLPDQTIQTKRPLLHAAIPSPFASSSSSAQQKTLYITPSTPFIPALKRISKLLAHAAERDAQSSANTNTRGKRRRRAEPNGRLEAGDVEGEIAGSVGARDRLGEEVRLVASGRAIARALGLGAEVRREGRGRVVVSVRMGSVRAVDDLECGESGDGEEVGETRVRTLSCVTVGIREVL